MDKHHVDRLYLLVGRIATDFSSIEQLWYLIFTCVLNTTPRDIADVIFSQFKTGRQQRQLILELINCFFLDPKHPLKLEIQDLAEQTKLAANRRNDAVHSIIQFLGFVVPPRVIAQGIFKRNKLSDKQIEPELCDLYRTVARLEMKIQELRLKMIEFITPQDSTLARDKQQIANAKQGLEQLLDSDPILRVLEGRS